MVEDQMRHLFFGFQEPLKELLKVSFSTLVLNLMDQ